MADFPNRIRELRTSRKWSLDRLASLVGCSKVQISDLERGNIQLTVEWMRRIGAALDVAPAELLTPSDNPFLLSDAEREWIERYRAAKPAQRQNLEAVAEALVPYRSGAKERAA